ncbi:competence protein [Bordetella pertussis]|nr:competence protein [Bordetella pertussis]
MAVTLALTPLLAFLVRQVSLGSPLANALAIPVVSLRC